MATIQPPPEIASTDEGIDLKDLLRRLLRGYRQILGFALLGAVALVLFRFILSQSEPVPTTTRVIFSFEGMQRNQYPDTSKFQPDDIRAPDIIQEALRRLKLDSSEGVQGEIRGALSIEGLISPGIARERDRLRASGQIPPPYVPDEYSLTLLLRRSFPISIEQRKALINEVVNVYREKFQKTYVDMPQSFGNAFEALRDADYPEYEFVLGEETRSIITFLEQQLDPSDEAKHSQQNASGSRSFRSRTTGFSYADLLQQARLFSQVHLSETLGSIYSQGLTKDRNHALVKMDYRIYMLNAQEQELAEMSKVISTLLQKDRERAQNYVLGVKSQTTSGRPEGISIDQNLVDSLLANDAYNFLVRRSLDIGTRLAQVQSRKARLQEQRERVASFTNADPALQEQVVVHVRNTLATLEKNYRQLITNVQATHADFSRQYFADAIRLSAEISTPSPYSKFLLPLLGGFCGGLAAGMALSLLGIYLGDSTRKN